MPCTHLRPASITENFEELIINGTRAMSGSDSDQLEEGGHRLLGVEQALVHVHVDDLGAVLHLVAGDGERGRIVAGGDQLAETRRAGDVGALADIHERDLRRQRERFQPREPQPRRDSGTCARRLACDRRGDGADVVGRGAAAAADDVDEAAPRPIRRSARPWSAGSRHSRRIRWAGRRWDRRRPACRRCAPVRRCAGASARRRARNSARRRAARRGAPSSRTPPPFGPTAVRPERSVMVPEIMIGSGSTPRVLEHLGDRDDRGLGVQRVEDRLDQEEVDAAVDAGRAPARDRRRAARRR